MMNNKLLWSSVCRTDPAAVKPITGKQYQGNSPKPYWIIERATDTFGPCGIGWGVIVNSERFERLTDTDVLHVADVTVWYNYDGKRGELQQMGQTKAVYKTSKGVMMIDEDAPKKSVTDGMVKCLSMIGFAGDIFSGRWDDSKYVAEVYEEYAQAKLPPVVLVDSTMIANIEALITELGVDKAAFLAAGNVTKVGDIQASSYDKVIALLEKKRNPK